MATVTVRCPGCGGTQVHKNGKSKNGTQRYICYASECATQTFRLDYRYEGGKTRHRAENHCHGSQRKRCTGHSQSVRHLNRQSYEYVKKAKDFISPINLNYINEHPNIELLRCDIMPYHEVCEAELDEMWSYLFSKENPRWLWLAIDHQMVGVKMRSFEGFENCWPRSRSISFTPMIGLVINIIDFGFSFHNIIFCRT